MKKLVVYQWLTNYVCAPYRIWIPAQALNQLPDFRVVTIDQMGQRQFDEVYRNANLFLIQRLPMMPNLDRIIQELQKNIVVAYELDDNLLEIDPQSRFASEAPADYSSRIRACIQACDYVQCSTRPLAEVIRTIHPRVSILENQMLSAPPFRAQALDPQRIVIAYAAGQDHAMDWEMVRSAYIRSLQELEAFGIKVETWIIGDRAIFESIPSEHKKHFPTMPRDPYLEILDRVDISIIPLRDTVFNRCKSDVKFLESASRSAAVLASRTVYANSIIDGQTGLLFDDANSFQHQLVRLAKDRNLANSIAQSAHDYVCHHRLIQDHIQHWANTYRAWCSHASPSNVG